MTTQLTRSVTRRGILKALGLGAATLALEPILEPVAKKMWFVPSTAPVGSRVERLEAARNLKRALWRTVELDAEAMVSRWHSTYGVFIDEEVQFTAEDYAALQKHNTLRLPGIQTEPVDLVDLYEGSEWSFENGTRVRFGKGSRAYAARDDDYWFTAGLGSKWPAAMAEIEGSYKPTTASIIHKGPGRRG
jgi:hypothetical protein